MKDQINTYLLCTEVQVSLAVKHILGHIFTNVAKVKLVQGGGSQSIPGGVISSLGWNDWGVRRFSTHTYHSNYSFKS